MKNRKATPHPGSPARLAAFPKAIVVDLRDKPHIEGVFGIVKPGEHGYNPIYTPLSLEEMDELTAEEFNTRKPTPAERQAAFFGSMFGWGVPGADPAAYSEDGVLMPRRA